MNLNQCTVFDCSIPNNPVPIAAFALDSSGNGFLGYGMRYIERPDAFPLDPVNLPLSGTELFIPRHQDGSYGVLSDAGPNAWGIRLTSSICKKINAPQPVTPIDWLLLSWHYGSGCIGFSASKDVEPNPGVQPEPLERLNGRLLSVIENLSQKIDTDIDEEAVRLFAPGASLGGVRPKTVVMHEGIEHIAKFSRLDDAFNVPAAEYAAMRLAHQAGINVPAFELCHIAGRDVLLIERFDRDERGHRLHYISAKSLINIDQVSPEQYKTKFSYAGIAETMRLINDHAVKDSQELFRRMVLNILVGNVDDHMRNHAMVMKEPGKFVLSPAFDIVPHLQAMSFPQSIGVGAYGAASTMKNAISQCGRFFLSPAEAKNIIDEVREVTSHWRSVLRESGMSDTDIRILSTSFSAADEAERLSIPVGQQRDEQAEQDQAANLDTGMAPG